MKKSTTLVGKIGARVKYCGHDGYFVADIITVAGAAVVRASKPVTSGNIIRKNVDQEATHQLSDFPEGGFWRPDLGVFVVPAAQVVVLKPGAATPPAEKQLSKYEARMKCLQILATGRVPEGSDV